MDTKLTGLYKARVGFTSHIKFENGKYFIRHLENNNTDYNKADKKGLLKYIKYYGMIKINEDHKNVL